MFANNKDTSQVNIKKNLTFVEYLKQPELAKRLNENIQNYFVASLPTTNSPNVNIGFLSRIFNDLALDLSYQDHVDFGALAGECLDRNENELSFWDFTLGMMAIRDLFNIDGSIKKEIYQLLNKNEILDQLMEALAKEYQKEDHPENMSTEQQNRDDKKDDAREYAEQIIKQSLFCSYCLIIAGENTNYFSEKIKNASLSSLDSILIKYRNFSVDLQKLADKEPITADRILANMTSCENVILSEKKMASENMLKAMGRALIELYNQEDEQNDNDKNLEKIVTLEKKLDIFDDQAHQKRIALISLKNTLKRFEQKLNDEQNKNKPSHLIYIEIKNIYQQCKKIYHDTIQHGKLENLSDLNELFIQLSLLAGSNFVNLNVNFSNSIAAIHKSTYATDFELCGGRLQNAIDGELLKKRNVCYRAVLNEQPAITNEIDIAADIIRPIHALLQAFSYDTHLFFSVKEDESANIADWTMWATRLFEQGTINADILVIIEHAGQLLLNRDDQNDEQLNTLIAYVGILRGIVSANYNPDKICNRLIERPFGIANLFQPEYQSNHYPLENPLKIMAPLVTRAQIKYANGDANNQLLKQVFEEKTIQYDVVHHIQQFMINLANSNHLNTNLFSDLIEECQKCTSADKEKNQCLLKFIQVLKEIHTIKIDKMNVDITAKKLAICKKEYDGLLENLLLPKRLITKSQGIKNILDKYTQDFFGKTYYPQLQRFQALSLCTPENYHYILNKIISERYTDNENIIHFVNVINNLNAYREKAGKHAKFNLISRSIDMLIYTLSNQGYQEALDLLFSQYRVEFFTNPKSNWTKELAASLIALLTIEEVKAKKIQPDEDRAENKAHHVYTGIVRRLPDETRVRNVQAEMMVGKHRETAIRFLFKQQKNNFKTPSLFLRIRFTKKELATFEHALTTALNCLNDNQLISNFNFPPNVWDELNRTKASACEWKGLLLAHIDRQLQLLKEIKINKDNYPNAEASIRQLTEVVKNAKLASANVSNQELVTLANTLEQAQMVFNNAAPRDEESFTSFVEKRNLNDLTKEEQKQLYHEATLKDHIIKLNETDAFRGMVRWLIVIDDDQIEKRQLIQELNAMIEENHFNPFLRAFDDGAANKKEALIQLRTQIEGKNGRYEVIYNKWLKTYENIIHKDRSRFFTRHKKDERYQTKTEERLAALKVKYKDIQLKSETTNTQSTKEQGPRPRGNSTGSSKGN